MILMPALVLFIGLVVGGARIWWAQACVQSMADSAARQASISRTAAEAAGTAESLVRRDAVASGLGCGRGLTVTVDTSGFAVPVGRPAAVGARVTCTVTLADLFVPGMPGSFTADASARSTLDRYRGRR
ncbi:hypothetical protein [Nigerium massiliense]|uniref:hypothetical protein n=1 Tax=Nigerium massiliense TaxID=1522317 RepID=UPI0006941E5E|nr:hypothetical protein [Nigerium massiliense]